MHDRVSERAQNQSNDSATKPLDDVVERTWRAIVDTDVDSALSHVEVLFGSSDHPWDGIAHRRVTYYLTSNRTNDLVLLSFNSCVGLCSGDFPRCFRVNYDDDDLDDNVTSTDGGVKQCGRRFPKTQGGVRDAFLLARDVHRRSMAKDEPLWATLVQYNRDGQFRRLQTWPALEDVFVACPNSALKPRCAEPWWQLPIVLFVCSLALVLLLTLIWIVSSTLKARRLRRAGAPATAVASRAQANQTRLVNVR